jgi:hypothetical protein
MISADYYRKHSSLEINFQSDFSKLKVLDGEGLLVFVKSGLAEKFFNYLLLDYREGNTGSIFILHGNDKTISIAKGRDLSSKGFIIKSVNWLGDQSLIQPLPIGIPTLDRLIGVKKNYFEEYLATYEKLSKKDVFRDVRLYSNFDITTNLPNRKDALLASLRIKNSYSPKSRIGLIENLEIIRRSEFVLSPPGAGPDCFRTWEAMYLGAIPIVLRSHWPFSHLDLPVLIVDSFDDLEHKISDFENESRARNKSWEDYFLLP